MSSNRSKVTKAEKDLKLQFIQNMNSNTKCNFCNYFINNKCTVFDNTNYNIVNREKACAEALNRLTSILRS